MSKHRDALRRLLSLGQGSCLEVCQIDELILSSESPCDGTATVASSDGDGARVQPADAWTLRSMMSGPMDLISRGVVYASFVFAKQPSRIRSVLMQVRS